MRLFSILKTENILYFPGCDAYFKKELEKLEKIFLKLGIEYKLIKGKCCGLPALETGYSNEARKIFRKNFEIFKEKNVKKIITTCPKCYKAFKIDYKKYIPEWDFEIINVWKTILEKIQKKPKLIKNKSDEEVCFQDSCYLGRYCGVYEEPREILKIIGYRIKEFRDNRENSICCGSCGELPRINVSIAEKIAKEKIVQIKRVNMKKMVVCSYREYDLLSKVSSGIEILLFSDLLANSLGIKMEEKND